MKNNPDSFVPQIRRLVSTALLLLTAIAVLPPLHAQRRYALDPAPNVAMRSAEIASVEQVIGLPDGRILVVGQSTYVNGVQHPRTGLFRLDSSGQLDPTFAAPAGHTIAKAALTPDGGIWALGDFNGTYSDSVVKLTVDGALAPGFTPIGAAEGNRLAALPDNGFYLFDESTGVTTVRRFGSDGQPAPGFTTVVADTYAWFSTASPTGQIALITYNNGPSSILAYDGTGAALPNATAGIPADFHPTGIVLDSQGGMVLSGTSFPAPSPMLIRILPSGLRDTAFDGTTPVAGPFGDGVVALADGSFVTHMRSGWGYPAQVLEFSATGTLRNLRPVSFDLPGSPSISAVWSLSSGGYLVSGNFDRVAGISAPRLARVTSSGTVDSGFQALIESTAQVGTLAQSASGVFVGGYFTHVNQSTAGNLAILNGQNVVDTAFPWVRWGTNSIVPLAGGGTLVMGYFEPFPGTATYGLVKLRSDRTVDTGFLSGTSLGGTFETGLALPGGSVLLGGSFGINPGSDASFLMKVTPAGSIDPTFNHNFSLSGGWSPKITALAAHPAGGYLVGGSFTEIQGASRPAIARITNNGTLDPTFVPPVGMSPYLPPKSITVLPDGRFYALGALGDAFDWWMINLYRFNADGTLDNTFTSPFDYVTAYALAGNGDVFVAGSNDVAPSTQYPNLVRVSASGAIDSTFSFTLDTQPLALLVDAKGRLVVGGYFTVINGQSRQALARLVPLPLSVTIDGPARVTVPLRGTVTLSASVASAVGPISYQWYHDCEKIRNATGSSLTLTLALPKDEGRYTVIVSGSGETAESPSVTLKVKRGH